MKIQYASDIHLELSDNSNFINSMPFAVTGDVLVFAGDIGYLRDKTLPNMKFWKWASANYREVLLVPGNHEFYGNGDVLAYGNSWSRKILPNVHYYQNKVVRIDDTDFILSTLWSHIQPQDEYFVSRGMNDFGRYDMAVVGLLPMILMLNIKSACRSLNRVSPRVRQSILW